MDEHCPHRRASLVHGPQRGGRAALPLSRLEGGRRRQRARDGLGAGGERPVREGEAHGLSGRGGGRLRLGVHGPARKRCRAFEPPAFAPTRRDARLHRQGARRVQLGADPRGRDRLGAQLEPALDRHAAGARRRRQGDRQGLAAALDRQGAAPAAAADAVRLPLRRDPPADRELRDPRLHPHHALRRAVHGAHPAEQPATTCRSCTSRRTTRNTISTSSRGATRAPGIDQEAWRKFCGAQPGVDLDHEVPQAPHARQQLPAGPPGDEARRLHRHPRHPDAGHGDVGDDGHRSPTAARERLGASDLAIVEFRRIMVEAARAAPRAARRSGPRRVARAKLRSFEGIVPKATDWRTFNAPNRAAEPVRAAD